MGASTLYSLGIALQAMDARQTPHREYLRLSLVRNLVKRGRWLRGTGLSLLGWPLQLLALSMAPLVVVQPAMAAGLLVLLVVGERMLGERAGRREHLAVSAIVVGVVGAALCAPPHTTTQASDTVIAIVLGVLGLASLLPYVMLRLARRPPATITMASAGLAYGWSGVATKLASDNLGYGFLWIAVAWGVATAAISALAALSEMSALQSRPAIQVAPVVFVIQTSIPVALAPLLFGERFTETPLDGALLAVSLLVLIAGAAVLARSPLLTTLFEGGVPSIEGDPHSERDGELAREGELERREEELVSAVSDSEESPPSPSQDAMRSTPRTDATDPAAVTTKTSPARVWR